MLKDALKGRMGGFGKETWHDSEDDMREKIICVGIEKEKMENTLSPLSKISSWTDFLPENSHNFDQFIDKNTHEKLFVESDYYPPDYPILYSTQNHDMETSNAPAKSHQSDESQKEEVEPSPNPKTNKEISTENSANDMPGTVHFKFLKEIIKPLQFLLKNLFDRGKWKRLKERFKSFKEEKFCIEVTEKLVNKYFKEKTSQMQSKTKKSEKSKEPKETKLTEDKDIILQTSLNKALNIIGFVVDEFFKCLGKNTFHPFEFWENFRRALELRSQEYKDGDNDVKNQREFTVELLALSRKQKQAQTFDKMAEIISKELDDKKNADHFLKKLLKDIEAISKAKKKASKEDKRRKDAQKKKASRQDSKEEEKINPKTKPTVSSRKGQDPLKEKESHTWSRTAGLKRMLERYNLYAMIVKELIEENMFAKGLVKEDLDEVLKSCLREGKQ